MGSFRMRRSPHSNTRVWDGEFQMEGSRVTNRECLNLARVRQAKDVQQVHAVAVCKLHSKLPGCLFRSISIATESNTADQILVFYKSKKEKSNLHSVLSNLLSVKETACHPLIRRVLEHAKFILVYKRSIT